MQILETLTYIGRNRRSEKCVIEKLVELTPVELEAITKRGGNSGVQLGSALRAHGIPVDTDTFSKHPVADDAAGFFASLYAESVLAIQRATGHRVSFAKTINDPSPNRNRVVFEYEQEDVAQRADLLALNLLVSVIPEINWVDQPPDETRNLSELFTEFKEFAPAFVLPPDTQAIIDAAARLDIPCVKLEREPYQGVTGEFRIRKNGLLKLGHSVYQHILDGTFCIDKGAHIFPLLRDRDQLFQYLSQLQVPVARQDREFRNCVSFRRAERLAASIGFPVVVKPSMRSHGQGISLNINDEGELRAAVGKAQRFTRKVLVEKHVEGVSFKVIVANKEIVGVVSVKDNRDVLEETHPSTRDLALSLAEKLDVGLFVMDVVTTGVNQPLSQPNGAVVDVDFAPELERILSTESELHKRAMSGLVQWLFPGNARSRIPLVAVTGTNGKTTTCRMIMSIMQAGHFHAGFACTDGVYINNKLVEKGDRAGRGGHHRVLESREVNLGILETARGALAKGGLMFDWCNVSVCLNVTEDHLGEYGIETVGQMAELKRTVLESARGGAVLFADDEHCINMLPFLVAPRVCLVSMHLGVEELARIPGDKACFGVSEHFGGSDWLVIYDGDQRIPVIKVEQIPATFGGAARFNVCNALHAIAASYLMGIEIGAIREGMRAFGMSFENTPGRLNVSDIHPFTVIMDFAHNIDGISKLCEFVDQMSISGRKVLMFQVRGDVGDGYIKRMATAAAGHFDHYVGRTHPDPIYTGPDEQKVLALIKEALLESGVAEHQIVTTTDQSFAVETTLKMGREGDLLVFTPGSEQRADTWQQIISFESG